MTQPRISTEILGAFREGAVDLTNTWEQSARDLGGESAAEARFKLGRTLDNLRGAASGIGLNRFAEFMRQVAELLDFLDGRGRRVLAERADLMLEALAFTRLWIGELANDVDYTPDLREWQQKVFGINPAARFEKWSPSGAARNLGSILIENREATPEQVARAARLQERKLGEVMVDEGMITPSTLQKSLAAQAKADPNRPKLGETIKVPAGRIDNLLKIIGELSIHQSIIWHSRQAGTLGSRHCQNAIVLSNKIIRDVQAQMMALRLQPLRSLFQRLERTARDVSMAQTKNVQTLIEGADTDLDKAVIERLGDPFLHMIRNAVDHGIETPEERVKAGKPETATLRISAATDTGDVVIQISDDGRGMDPERILRKAIEKGFVSQGAQIRRADVFNLIFMPGFSTSDQVTEFSGRGVGMDVVNRTVNDLGGTITIRSEVGKGTTFVITIPTSVSLMDAVVFTVDGLRYVVPMRDLVEVIDLREFSIEVHPDRGALANLRGDVLPVEHLRKYLPRAADHPELSVYGRGGFGALTGAGGPVAAVEESSATNAAREAEASRMPALILKSEEGMIAFRVDRVLGQQQIVVRTLNDSLARIPGYVGGTILGDGEPGMIVGLSNLARGYFERIRRNKERVA